MTDPLRIGLRAQDIQTSIQDISLGPLNAEVKSIRLTGMAERLAIHIRGLDVIPDYKRLEYVASQFGIDSLLLPSVLNVLQDLGWARVYSARGEITKIEETVPYFSDIYSKAGEYFHESNPSSIEQLAIAVCDALSQTPITEDSLKAQFGMDNKAYHMVLDIGRSGRLIEAYESKSTGEKVLYSPLYWSENPKLIEQLFQLLKEYGAEKVSKVLKSVRAYQGLPFGHEILRSEEAVLKDDQRILVELIRRGIILAPEVNSLAGPKNFAFVPHIGLSLEEKVILEKAMAVLACIRYGQHFGVYSRIKWPESICDALITPPHRIYEHSDIRRQYAILVGRGMGTILPSERTKGRFDFQLIATNENIKAVKLAKDLLRVGEVLEGKGLSEELKGLLLYEGTYEEAVRTLPKLKRPAQISPTTQQEIFNIINDVTDKLRGA